MRLINSSPDIFLLGAKVEFPDPNSGDFDDLIAIGGDLSAKRLLLAYKSGIFPWFIERSLPYWFCPNPRSILYPSRLHISKSLAKTIRKRRFEIAVDRDFEAVMRRCAAPRKNAKRTWITGEFIDAYLELFELGAAHSVECYSDGGLCGGLYGVSIGRVFFGESMFAALPDASKSALCYLAREMPFGAIDFIDCQIPSDHLLSLGAEEISRSDFLELLKKSVVYNS
ncbi:MAG: leucyl/phenylalanyl-tRNA--protein transferase [Helicobacteraceae bacterium]|nr:leucyl/phenylalanyl-tRNA--protein transferase [Helicobacteraceae bacterium]